MSRVRGKQNMVTLWSLSKLNLSECYGHLATITVDDVEQHVLKLFFQKMEKQFVVNPPLITIGIIHPTHFVSAPHIIHFFAAKITNGDKHCPLALPQPITTICCFYPDV